MTERQLQLSLQTGKLQLSFWDKVTHYGIVVTCFLMLLISMFFSVQDLFHLQKQGVKAMNYLMLITALLGGLFYKIQSDRLKFKQVCTTLARQQLIDIINQVAHELKWQVRQVDKQYIIAKTNPPFFSGSWGEQIVILFDNDRVLVNSICDPNKRSSLVSMGRNKKNETKIINAIEHASR